MIHEIFPKPQTLPAMPVKPSPPAAAETRPEQAAQAGFEQVFQENWNHVLGLLRGLVGDPAEAEDLALETFVRLYQRPPRPDPAQNIGGWLHRVAANLGLSSLRGAKRRQRYELEAGKLDLEQNPGQSPAELLAQAEERRLVRSVLAGMNPRQAELLALRFAEGGGKSYREIAAILGVAPTSIGPLLARAEKEFERRCRAIDQGGE